MEMNKRVMYLTMPFNIMKKIYWEATLFPLSKNLTEFDGIKTVHTLPKF